MASSTRTTIKAQCTAKDPRPKRNNAWNIPSDKENLPRIDLRAQAPAWSPPPLPSKKPRRERKRSSNSSLAPNMQQEQAVMNYATILKSSGPLNLKPESPSDVKKNTNDEIRVEKPVDDSSVCSWSSLPGSASKPVSRVSDTPQPVKIKEKNSFKEKQKPKSSDAIPTESTESTTVTTQKKSTKPKPASNVRALSDYIEPTAKPKKNKKLPSSPRKNAQAINIDAPNNAPNLAPSTTDPFFAKLPDGSFIKGKQRLKPKKKHFTTLKKKILMERVQQWNDLHSTKESTSQEDSNPQSLASEFVICLENILTEDDFEDEDCFQETKDDVTAIAQKFGQVIHIDFMREGEEKGLVFVTYFSEEKESMDKILEKWSQQVLGGTPILASLPSPKKEDTPQHCVVRLEHVLTEDDFEDDECFQETKDDVSAIAQQFGQVINIDFVREGDDKGLVFVTYAKGQDINNIVEQWSQLVLAGNQIKAFLHPIDKEKDFTICLENILTEDDLEDEECLEETKTDVSTLSAQFGHVVDIQYDLPKKQILVTYKEESMDKIIHNWSQTIIAGNQVQASLITHVECTLCLKHILNEDDFEDEECFEETKQDVSEVARQFGEVVRMKFERDGVNKGLVFATYKVNDEALIKNVMDSWSNTVVSGSQVEVSLVTEEQCNSTQNVSIQEEIPNHSRNDAPIPQENTPQNNPTTAMDPNKKIIPERFAACKRVPKIPNSGLPRAYASRIDDESTVPLVKEMLAELMRLQLKGKNDANARSRRRIVMGLREVTRGIRAKQIKMVIMAYNLDQYGALDAKLQEILDLSEEEEIPVIFELNKRNLGKAIGKNIKVAVVGVQNADGAHEKFKRLKKLAGLPRLPPVVET